MSDPITTPDAQGGSIQLNRNGGIHVFRVQGCIPEKAGRVRRDCGGHLVVRLARHPAPCLRVELFAAGRRQREDRDVNTGRVHRRDPPVAEIEEPVHHAKRLEGVGLIVQAPLAVGLVVRQSRMTIVRKESVDPSLGDEVILEVERSHGFLS